MTKTPILTAWCDAGAPGSYPAFQASLLAAHRAGTLTLARCDYRAGLTADELDCIEDSTITDGHATYHYIVTR